MNAKNIKYFDSFRVEHIPKEIRKNSLEIKMLKRILIEYKHLIQ